MQTQRAAMESRPSLRRWMWLPAAACLLTALPRAAEAQLGSIPSPAYLRHAACLLERQLLRRLGRVSKRVQCGDQVAGESIAERPLDRLDLLSHDGGRVLLPHGATPRSVDPIQQRTLTLYAAFHDWMLRVQFPPAITAGRSRIARRSCPWGMSQRTSGLVSSRRRF